MAITIGQLLDKLNGDPTRECAALIRYMQHASVLTGAEYESLIQELLTHANEEIVKEGHACDLLTALGR